MAVLTRLFDFIPGTLIQSAQVDSEFNQLVDLLSGVSTSKDALIKFSDGTNPVLRVDQLGAGAIQHWLQNGSEKARISNTGALNLGSIAGLDALNRIAINLDTDPGNILIALRTLNSSDQGMRIIMDGATSTGIVAFSVLDDDGGKFLMRVSAGGDVEVPAGHPSNITDSPTKRITLGGQYGQSLTTVGNVGAGEDDLHSYTIPGFVLANDGDSIYFSACGTILAAGTTKQLRMFFGGTAVFTSGFFDPAVDFAWSINGDITRIDSDSIIANVLCLMGDGVIGGNAALANRATQVDGLTFTGNLILKWTGADTDGVNNRVVQSMSVLRKFARNTT